MANPEKIKSALKIGSALINSVVPVLEKYLPPRSLEEILDKIYVEDLISQYNKLCNEILAPFQQETAWMIEWIHPVDRQGPLWRAGAIRSSVDDWTDDPNQGIRFSRKSDAEKVIDGLSYSARLLCATEHQWE